MGAEGLVEGMTGAFQTTTTDNICLVINSDWLSQIPPLQLVQGLGGLVFCTRCGVCQISAIARLLAPV